MSYLLSITGPTGPSGNTGATGPTGATGSSANAAITSNQIAYGTGIGITSSSNLTFDGIVLNVNNNKILNVGTPSNPTDAVNLRQISISTTQLAFGSTSSNGITSSSSLVFSNSELNIVGGIKLNNNTFNSNTSLTQSNYTALGSLNGMKFTLPQASQSQGKIYNIKAWVTFPNNISVAPFAGDTIDGNPTDITLNGLGVSGLLNAITLHCDGSAWYIISDFYTP